MNEDAEFYYLLDIDDNPPNRTGECEQCGSVDTEIEYAYWLDLWRCVESFPCEIVADELEKQQVQEPVLELEKY